MQGYGECMEDSRKSKPKNPVETKVEKSPTSIASIITTEIIQAEITVIHLCYFSARWHFPPIRFLPFSIHLHTCS